MVVAKKIVYAKPFKGAPVPDNFAFEEENLPELQEGEILCQAEFLSVDPYMRAFLSHSPIPTGSTMIGGQVARIIESKNAQFPVGNCVFGQFGWRTHTVVNPSKAIGNGIVLYLLPDFEGLPNSLGLGALGMPGFTAYFGLLDLCQPKPGETVVITAAAGAVGSLVGQIAKIKGCRVIGFAGTDEKCVWLKDELGFDVVINYKKADLAKELKQAAPKGVDCYFDNVGGEMSSIIINQMNLFGRIAACGSIASYNHDVNELPKATILQPAFIFKQLRMEGFLSNRWTDRRLDGILAMKKWIKEGKLKFRETVYEGFENMPKAFINMLEGNNVGKVVIKV